MKILVACEESQVVTKEFRKLGHEAYSCDIQPCSGGHPEWHFERDVNDLAAYQGMLTNKQKWHWDIIIAFPPCTDLAVSGARWFKEKQADGRQQASIDFFMYFVNHPCPKIAIENPIGIMSTKHRKPDQIIQPWQFGHSTTKATCLWLKNLPLLQTTNIVDKGKRQFCKSGKSSPIWHAKTGKGCGKLRSKTYPGIAKAMAEQWAGVVE